MNKSVQRKPDSTKECKPHEAHDKDAGKDEDVVERIVRHISERINLRYAVHWYNFLRTDDAVERENHIPQHFITRYKERVNKMNMENHYATKMELLYYTVQGKENEEQNNKLYLTKPTYSASA